MPRIYLFIIRSARKFFLRFYSFVPLNLYKWEREYRS
jgi:hypothetical protein